MKKKYFPYSIYQAILVLVLTLYGFTIQPTILFMYMPKKDLESDFGLIIREG